MIDLILGILSSILGNRIDKFLPRKRDVVRKRKTSLNRYYETLKSQINEMPFIYKDDKNQPSILDEYVDVEFVKVDLLKFSEQDRISHHSSDTLKKSRLIFLGNAGFGKTTFFRYSILQVIRSSKTHKKINSRNDSIPLIPIYVSLKVVKNNRPFPIVRYILENNPSLLPSDSPMEKLIEYAGQKRIFLVLDGYDEISYVKGKNYIRQELENLFERRKPYELDLSPLNESKFEKYLRAIYGCRIWVSTRMEFFAQNPISTALPGNYSLYDLTKEFRLPKDISGILVKGIGDQRGLLVERLFKRYTAKGGLYHEILSEEYFLECINTSSDKELISMSQIPLFLTVLCFVYITKAISAQKHDVEWLQGYDRIILECVALLLYSLDERKTERMKEVGEAEKTAILRRRNAFGKAKKEFLEYFAGISFLEEKDNVFRYEEIKDKAIHFFEKINPNFPEVHLILEGFQNPQSNNADFVTQLIYSGVFVIAEHTPEGKSYDFPHRRFREFLAVEYFNSEKRYKDLINNIDRRNLSEFCYVFFQYGNYQEEIFSALMNRTKNYREDNFYNVMVKNLIKIDSDLRRKGNPRKKSPLGRVSEQFFITCLEDNSFFQLPKEILNILNPDETFIELTAKHFRYGVSKGGNLNSLSLAAEILLIYNTQTLRELIRNSYKKQTDDLSSLHSVINRFAFILDNNLDKDVFKSLFQNREYFLEYLSGLSTRANKDQIISTISALRMPQIKGQKINKIQLESFREKGVPTGKLSPVQELILFEFFFKFLPEIYNYFNRMQPRPFMLQLHYSLMNTKKDLLEEKEDLPQVDIAIIFDFHDAWIQKLILEIEHEHMKEALATFCQEKKLTPLLFTQTFPPSIPKPVIEKLLEHTKFDLGKIRQIKRAINSTEFPSSLGVAFL